MSIVIKYWPGLKHLVNLTQPGLQRPGARPDLQQVTRSGDKRDSAISKPDHKTTHPCLWRNTKDVGALAT